MSTFSGNGELSRLSEAQRAAILELGSRGSGGEFDSGTMSELFAKGLISVHSQSRRVVLTELGERAFGDLSRPPTSDGRPHSD